ncbi:MAG: sigma 54-interacting transcriptional regulator [Deltaproteobacteria bacterium]|nr:sigma 54-interacting transcriptional regulator [Deltaproteobacteria bacterium]
MSDDDFEEDTARRTFAQVSGAGDEVTEPRSVSLLLYHRGRPKVVPLSSDKAIVVGRQSPSDVVLSDHLLSRTHARFELVGDRVWVEDLDSTNGTWVDETRITRVALDSSSEVRIGTTTVVAHLLGVRDSPLHRVIDHDQFLDVLREELGRAKALGLELSMMVVRSNSAALGHVSRWVGKVRKLLRPTDRIAIYSADTVEISLPKQGKDDATRLARRLVAAAAPGAPSLYCGIAIYPLTATSVDGLLAGCTQALEQASDRCPIQLHEGADGFSWMVPSAEVTIVEKEEVETGPAMRAVYALADRFSRTDMPVLITGETGTGKEILAQRIHAASGRHDGRMCSVNCGALPEGLAESLLFGHRRGAFTGADQDRSGVFTEANGGTVFLDEIGELPLQTQVKLLRVLEAREVLPVGASKEVPVDVRVIAATHRDLEQMCRAGTFRDDLYYRLNVMTISLPALRDRAEEIPAFADFFLRQFALKGGLSSQVTRIAPAAMKCLRRHHWPGNVRELRNVIQRALVVAEGKEITVADLPESIRRPALSLSEYSLSAFPDDLDGLGFDSFGESGSQTGRFEIVSDVAQPDPNPVPEVDFKTRVQQFEAALIKDAMARAKGNQTEAAAVLRIPLRTLVRKLKAYGIDSKGEGG